MTRCKLMVITDANTVYSTVEYNGDGGWDSRGKAIYSKLKRVKTLDEFTKYVKKFNKEYYGYPIGDYVEQIKNFNIMDNWTDFIYIKNLTDQPICLNCRGGECVLAPYEFHTFYFQQSFNKSKDNKIVFEPKFKGGKY